MTELTRGEKLRETMVKKHGSLEAWKKAMQEQGRRGGKSPKTTPSGFAAMTPEQRAEAGRIGGLNKWARYGKNKSDN